MTGYLRGSSALSMNFLTWSRLVELDQEWFPGKEESDFVEIRDSFDINFIQQPRNNEQCMPCID
jgi:hypothetical protein